MDLVGHARPVADPVRRSTGVLDGRRAAGGPSTSCRRGASSSACSRTSSPQRQSSSPRRSGASVAHSRCASRAARDGVVDLGLVGARDDPELGRRRVDEREGLGAVGRGMPAGHVRHDWLLQRVLTWLLPQCGDSAHILYDPHAGSAATGRCSTSSTRGAPAAVAAVVAPGESGCSRRRYFSTRPVGVCGSSGGTRRSAGP